MGKMRKVLFIRSNPVDPDSRVEKEVSCLLENGYDVEIFCWDRSANYSIKESIKTINVYSVRIYRVGIKAEYGRGLKNLLLNLRFQLSIRRFLNENGDKYHFIHACDFDTAVMAAFFAKRNNKILIYDIFDFYTDAFRIPLCLKQLLLSMDIKLINKADAVIICSEDRKMQIKGSSPKKLTVIHNSPPVLMGNYDECLRNECVRIAYFGILSSGRMIEELLEVISRHPEYELHIGGFGMLKDLVQKYADSYNNIIFYGKVDYNNVLQLESKCHIITAIYDPKIKNHIFAAPNKFYEALMLGKPVIMCRGTGMSKVIEDNQIGLLINYDKTSLELGLDEMRMRMPYYKNNSAKEKALYNSYYSWDIMKERLLNLYKSFD